MITDYQFEQALDVFKQFASAVERVAQAVEKHTQAVYSVGGSIDKIGVGDVGPAIEHLAAAVDGIGSAISEGLGDLEVAVAGATEAIGAG